MKSYVIRKKVVFVILGTLSGIILSGCKNATDSSADKSNNYNLLLLLNQNQVVVEGSYWEGKMDISGCTSINVMDCNLYTEQYKNFIKDSITNLRVYVDSVQKKSNLSFETMNPKNYADVLKYDASATYEIKAGPETGNGFSRILILNVPHSVSANDITILVQEFRAEILSDSLKGALKVTLKDSQDYDMNLVFSFLIKKKF